MCTHYICGISDCSNFAHVIYMAQEISKLLPFFRYEVISLKREDFEEWYNNFFSVNKLRSLPRRVSPVIWRQWLGEGRSQSVELIGGFSDFMEFCKECLNVESLWSPKQVAAMANKVLESTSPIPPTKGFCICIVGAGNPATRLLIMELINYAKEIFQQSIHILLCDCTCHNNVVMEQIAEDCLYLQEESVVEVVPSLDVALKHCQLLIITKKIDRNQTNMLTLYFDFMVDIADVFVKHSRRSCRILLACTEYSCFNASVFMREYARVKGNQMTPNIAAVTSYRATECLQFLKHASSQKMENLSDTPVWGFIDENEGLVVDYLLTKFSYIKKVIEVPEGFLSIGSSYDTSTEKTSSEEVVEEEEDEMEISEAVSKRSTIEEEELHEDVEKDMVDIILSGIKSDSLKFNYCKVSGKIAMFENKLSNINEWVQLQKNSILFLHDRGPIMSQVNATIDLLKFWYGKKKPDEESVTSEYPPEDSIIFAGIPTDGSFGIQPGLVLSQPAVLKNGYLVPFVDYEEPRNYPKKKIDCAFETVDSFGLYWDYGCYESDMLMQKLWLKFGDLVLQQSDKEDISETKHEKSLKSRIRSCIKKQKQILKEINKELQKEEEESEIKLENLSEQEQDNLTEEKPEETVPSQIVGDQVSENVDKSSVKEVVEGDIPKEVVDEGDTMK